jgi:hypothetical protein
MQKFCPRGLPLRPHGGKHTKNSVPTSRIKEKWILLFQLCYIFFNKKLAKFYEKFIDCHWVYLGRYFPRCYLRFFLCYKFPFSSLLIFLLFTHTYTYFKKVLSTYTFKLPNFFPSIKSSRFFSDYQPTFWVFFVSKRNISLFTFWRSKIIP